MEGGGCRPPADSLIAVPASSPLAMRYYRSGNALWALDTLLGLLIPAILLATGVSARLRTLALRAGRSWLLSTALYALLFVTVSTLLTLPLTYYEEFVRQHAYGLSNQTLQKWMSDWGKASALSAVGLALVLWIPLPAASPEPAAVVALYRPRDRPADHVPPGDLTGMDRSTFQSFRTAEESRPGAADSRPGSPGRHSRQQGVRSRQERRHANRECLCQRGRRHQANCPLGHPARKAEHPTGGVCSVARDGTFRPASRPRHHHSGHPRGYRLAVPGAPCRRSADPQILSPIRIQPALRPRLFSLAGPAGERRRTGGEPCGAGVQPASGARSRPVRSGAHSGQPCGGRDLRPSIGGESRHSPPRVVLCIVAELSPVSGRPG